MHRSQGTDVGVLPDDPEDFDGAPIAIQLMGRRFQEEKVLSAAKVVDDVVHAK